VKRQRIELPTDILIRLRAREESAYKELVDCLGPALVNFAAQKLHSVDTAQDIVQEVLYRIWQQGEHFSPRGTVVTYLWAAVRNRVLNVLKHERIVRRSHSVFAEDAARAEELSREASADAKIESEEDLRRLRRALATLTEHQRTAFFLRYDQELTIPEIASVLGISPKGVERLMTRVRQIVREQFFRQE
jgi:RNA polymerase sigma-70 factor (ECF subfamily)